MPYKSKKQRKFFHANKKKLEKEGVSVAEWDAASKGKSLPEKVIPLREADFRTRQKRNNGN